MDLPEEIKNKITSEELADNKTEGEIKDGEVEVAVGGMWGLPIEAVPQSRYQQDSPKTKLR